MKLHFLHHALLTLLTVITLGSCSIDIPPQDQFSDPDAITDVKTARSLLTSCYLLYPHQEFQLSLLGNDFCMTNLSGKKVEQQDFFLWQAIQLNNFAEDTWVKYYNCIANCDILLDRLPDVHADTDADKQALAAIRAEGQTLKAMAYFDVLRLYASAYDLQTDTAGMLIKTRTGVEVKERSSKRESVAYLRQLLTAALSVDHYPAANGWLSTRAARYLLAEVCLYQGDWQGAADNARKVIADCKPSFLTADSYANLWAKASFNGRIFAFNTNQPFYSEIQCDSEGDYFALNPELDMPTNDGRYKWAVYLKEMQGQSRNLLGKYNKTRKENLNTAYINRMRYAGAYFILAEAEARMQQSAAAVATLNTYLKAVNAPLLDDQLRGEALINAILLEKSREFAGEGQNFFDLKRTRPATLPRYAPWGNTIRTVIKADDYRWTLPVPATEYRYNTAITQNTGWSTNKNE